MNIHDHKCKSTSWTPKHLEKADRGIKKLNHPFLPNKKIINIFHYNGHYLTVYSDGSLQRDKKVDADKIEQLPVT